MDTRWFALLHHDESYDPKYRIQLLNEDAATKCLRYAESNDLSAAVPLKGNGKTFATLVPLGLDWRRRDADEVAEVCSALSGKWWFKPFDHAQYMEPTTPAVIVEIAATLAAEGNRVATGPDLVAVEYAGQEPYVFFSEDFRSHEEEET